MNDIIFHFNGSEPLHILSTDLTLKDISNALTKEFINFEVLGVIVNAKNITYVTCKSSKGNPPKNP